ncbi:hypothetical protein [Photobacterium damselae]|uniref:hypothetical protein n=1 Tax=Photobacterium damselae TaxID=38293 RepID=UPI0010FD53C1|nr:hypothetical protein [Photobacterium damselae]KAB1512030.1 hypothetical protein FD717_010630 [Photobacterium damselae subsp. damselae]TLS67750.1 hypothetical protein FD718_15025 [Photobacterium damselae subsp. damselae]TLS76748.1 hypothetical protein FD721_13035 [Photobacterium damselae subsp. damselae]TLS84523.1 hypothetical protein FD720_17055 [Photobacterium damselae subsp. damselae]
MNKSYIAFYPLESCTVKYKINGRCSDRDITFTEQMSEIIYSYKFNSFELEIFRDGRIMFELRHYNDTPKILDIDQNIIYWNEWLLKLNAFYLILASEIHQCNINPFFSVSALTSRDVFLMSIKDGVVHEGIIDNSNFRKHQYVRISSDYREAIRINPKISIGYTIDDDILNKVSQCFEIILLEPGLTKTIAFLTKSIGEYELGQFDTSILFSWFCIERLLKSTGKEKIFNVIESLKEDLGYELYDNLHKVRLNRNKIVHHDDRLDIKQNDAMFSIITAINLVEKYHCVKLNPRLSINVKGFCL